MPNADFRVKGDALDPLAPIKVLAVMCHPADARSREEMFRRVPAKITIPRSRQSEYWPADMRLRLLWSEFLSYRGIGCLAGAMTLALAQLSALDRCGSAAEVLTLASVLAADWNRVTDLEKPQLEETSPSERSAAAIVDAFQIYRSVSHLWAALVYGKLKQRHDFQFASNRTLPTFLAYAEELGRLATTLRWQHSNPSLQLNALDLWTFTLPERVKKTAQAQIVQIQSGPGQGHEELGDGQRSPKGT